MPNPYHDARGRFSGKGGGSAGRHMRAATKVVKKVEHGHFIASPAVAARTLQSGIKAAKKLGYSGDARIYKRTAKRLGVKAGPSKALIVQRKEFRQQRKMQRLFGRDW